MDPGSVAVSARQEGREISDGLLSVLEKELKMLMRVCRGEVYQP